MAEELQNLLERIQKEGVDKAESEAAKIIATAQDKAKAITAEAKEKAEKTLRDAEEKGAAFEQRAAKSLEQAARDAVLSVERSITRAFEGIVNQRVNQALTPDTLKAMLVTVVEAYCAAQADESGIDVILNKKKQKEISDFLLSEISEETRKGIEIKADDGIISGFRVSVAKDKVEHDFSQAAIADALCQLLRPQLAEIMRNALKEDKKKG